MAHHWSNQFENQMSKEELEKMFSKDPSQPEATGKFPDGKMDPLDEGEIRIRVGIVEGRVVIEFGKPVSSIGFTRAEAMQIGNSIIEAGFKI